MERLMLQQDVNPIQGIQGQIVYEQGDIYSQVISKEERHGRIRGLGFGPTGSSSSKSTQSAYSELMERHLNDVNTIQTLQEKILQFEAERAEEKKQRAEAEKQRTDEQKRILDRLEMIEQLLPGVNVGDGPRNDISPGLQTKSSCASRYHDEDRGA